MGKDQNFSQENHASQLELTEFISQLSNEQLYREMPAGWNVLAVLAHLAFWDQRAIILIKKWQQEGISGSPMDTDVINETTRSFFRDLDPEKTKRSVSQSAVEMDALIDSLPDDFLQEIREKGSTVHLNRAEHRRMHVKEIKSAL